MKLYDITYIIEDEQHERLSALAERYTKINGWNEKEILQFAVAATSKNDIEEKLNFLERQIVSLEEEFKKQKKKNQNRKGYILVMRNVKNVGKL